MNEIIFGSFFFLGIFTYGCKAGFIEFLLKPEKNSLFLCVSKAHRL